MKLMNSQVFKFLILVCFCISIISCGSDDEQLENINEEIVEEDIEECLLPQRIVIGGAIFGDSSAEYEYENNRLVNFGNSTYEYINELLSKRIYENGFVEYSYNDQLQLIQITNFRKIEDSEDFEVISQSSYEYVDNRVVRIFDIDDQLRKRISYYPNTNNVDTIRSYVENERLRTIEYFRYDERNHPRKNIPFSGFSSGNWLFRKTDNNVTRAWMKYVNSQGEAGSALINEYDIEYNESGYPIRIVNRVTSENYMSVNSVTYINCQ